MEGAVAPDDVVMVSVTGASDNDVVTSVSATADQAGLMF
jgi:hypothetical protein